ncbi:MAG: hypothetical protein V4675_04050 [Verrucomicrobiota bacterium]
MPDHAPELIYRLIRRHTHDLRNHCSGIGLAATLLEELSEDPEVTATAHRLKRQVALIEFDIKLLLLTLENPCPVTVSVSDLLQFWRMKLQSLGEESLAITWPEACEASVALDSRLVVQVLSDLTLRAGARNPGLCLEVVVRLHPQMVVIDLVEPREGLKPPADYVNDSAAILAERGLKLTASADIAGDRWATSLSIPLDGSRVS